MSNSSPSIDLIKLKGSCHCNSITYTLQLPRSRLINPIGTRCNCRICTTTGFTSLHFQNPAQEFFLTSPSSKSEINVYAGTSSRGHRSCMYFCGKCSVNVFVEGEWEKQDGQTVEFFHINWGTVNQPPTGSSGNGNGKVDDDARGKGEEWVVDLSNIKMDYFNGLMDDWAAGKRDVPYQGGLL